MGHWQKVFVNGGGMITQRDRVANFPKRSRRYPVHLQPDGVQGQKGPDGAKRNSPKSCAKTDSEADPQMVVLSLPGRAGA